MVNGLALANRNKGVIENAGHVTDLLTRFDSVKKDLINKDIMRFKTLDEVDKYLNDETSYKPTSARQQLRKTQKAVHNVDLNVDAELLLDGADWQIWKPLSWEASCKLGRGTTWCTASTEDDYYYQHYTDQGPLFISINKHNDEKYQFHFETRQFMDKDDRWVDIVNLLDSNDELGNFYYNYLKDLLGIKGDTYTISVDSARLESIMETVGHNRNCISGDTAFQLMFDPWEVYDYGYNDFRTDSLFYLDDTSKELLKDKYGITEKDAIRIVQKEFDHPLYDVLYDAYMQGTESGQVNGECSAWMDAARKELTSCFKSDTSVEFTDEGIQITMPTDTLLAEYLDFDSDWSIFDDDILNMIGSIIAENYRLFDESDSYYNFDYTSANEVFRDNL